MSAGLSSPVTIPLGVTSAAISAGDASITGFNSQYIFSQWKNEKKILNLIAASEKYLHELNVSKYLIEFREKNKLLALSYSELAEKNHKLK